MARKKLTLKVWVIPYLTMDSEGRPAGAIPCDPNHDPGGYVGASKVVDTDHVPEVYKRGDPRMPTRKFKYEFYPEEDQAAGFVVPFSDYYCAKLMHGELMPADEKTASLTSSKFRPRDEFIQESLLAAAAKFLREFPDEDPPAELAAILS